MSPFPLQNGYMVIDIPFTAQDFNEFPLSTVSEMCEKENLIMEKSALKFGLDILSYEIKARIEQKRVNEGKLLMMVEGGGWGICIETDELSPFGAFFRHGEVLPIFYGRIFF